VVLLKVTMVNLTAVTLDMKDINTKLMLIQPAHIPVFTSCFRSKVHSSRLPISGIAIIGKNELKNLLRVFNSDSDELSI